jgi:cell division protein FtsQ
VTTVISKSDLANRRQQFRRERRNIRLLGLWRFCLAVVLAGGIGWASQQPLWQLKVPEQIQIVGNQHLKRQQIYQALKLSLPIGILAIDPAQLQKVLLSNLPLRSAQVRRQLLPPAVLVQVEEKKPIAFAPQPKGIAGFVDETGNWFSNKEYQNFQRPSLAVWGFQAEKAELWRQIYPEIARSEIHTQIVDLRDPGNIILRTELGEVYFGAFSTQFSAQLHLLDRMRTMKSYFKPNHIAFIDLRSTHVPMVRIRSKLP